MKAFFTVFILIFWVAGLTTIAQVAPEFVSGKVEFNIKNMGLEVNGTMTGIRLDFKQVSPDPGGWSLEGIAEPASISTGIALRDKHLKKSDYFDIAQYPVIRFRSSGIVAKGKNKYEGTFDLTIKGTTRTIIIPFTIQETGKSMDMKAVFTINRLDYGLGEESAILANAVNVKVYSVLRR